MYHVTSPTEVVSSLGDENPTITNTCSDRHTLTNRNCEPHRRSGRRRRKRRKILGSKLSTVKSSVMSRPRQRQKRERKEVSDDDQEPECKDSKKSASSEEESENKCDSNVIMRLPNIVRATVINRPSKVVRSPYMADIIVEGWRHDLPYVCYISLYGFRGSW